MADSVTPRSGHSAPRRAGGAWLHRFPPGQWLADYRPSWLIGDIVAGVTLAAYAIPVSLAYAGLAGLPPQVGVYGYLASATPSLGPRDSSPSGRPRRSR